jgi:class 3 adenylate cyclase
MEEAGEHDKLQQKIGAGKAGLKKYLNDTPAGQPEMAGMSKSKPIADLFPETTIMFADIAGFTAWSSARQPSQVFTLLETIYQQFDLIAKKRNVFKVEVVGDCYVAVCGLPDPRDDHFVVMARYSNECLKTFHELTNQLERTLGPE